MNFSSKLNVNAASVNFEISNVSARLKEFFDVLFISWKTNNVDSIISSITINTIKETELFFQELFINIYNLSLKSETNINADNVICAINTLDTILPEVLIFESDFPDVILVDYENVKERAFQLCFKRVRILFNLLLEIKRYLKSSGQCSDENYNNFDVFKNMAKEIENVLLVLSRLSRIKYFKTYLFNFSCLLWDLFNSYNELVEIRYVLLFALSNIADQLTIFLLWKVDCDNNEAATQLAFEIFDTLKSDLISGKFLSEEIAYVLNILERHGRFIGQFLDAVPENLYLNGLIIGSSVAKSIETDEVYEDYEKFLLNEFD